jgi:hypothetical protein
MVTLSFPHEQQQLPLNDDAPMKEYPVHIFAKDQPIEGQLAKYISGFVPFFYRTDSTSIRMDSMLIDIEKQYYARLTNTKIEDVQYGRLFTISGDQNSGISDRGLGIFLLYAALDEAMGITGDPTGPVGNADTIQELIIEYVEYFSTGYQYDPSIIVEDLEEERLWTSIVFSGKYDIDAEIQGTKHELLDDIINARIEACKHYVIPGNKEYPSIQYLREYHKLWPFIDTTDGVKRILDLLSTVNPNEVPMYGLLASELIMIVYQVLNSSPEMLRKFMRHVVFAILRMKSAEEKAYTISVVINTLDSNIWDNKTKKAVIHKYINLLNIISTFTCGQRRKRLTKFINDIDDWSILNTPDIVIDIVRECLDSENYLLAFWTLERAIACGYQDSFIALLFSRRLGTRNNSYNKLSNTLLFVLETTDYIDVQWPHLYS